MPYRKKPQRKDRKPKTLSGRFRQLTTRVVRRKPKQARFNVSKRTYNSNRRIARAMSKYGETKLLSLTDVNPGAQNGTPDNVLGAGANPRVYAWRGVLQLVPTGWDTGLVNLAGMQPVQGLGANQHIGNYVYFKKTTVNLQIDMVYNTTATRQLQFRMVVLKSRQLAVPAGTTQPPQTTMFIDQLGTAQGYSSTGDLAMTTFEVMNNPINKRDWYCLRDHKFFMNNPASMDQGKYPSRKNFRITLPHYNKTKVGVNGGIDDYDAKYLIYVFATVPGALTDAQLPDDFRVALRGTTSFTDN